jgi:xanthosine utilization system XapX-like protein
MKPIVVPASSANMAYATMAATVIVWCADEFAKVKIPSEVAVAIGGLLSLIVGHFTTDTPAPTIAREAVDEAADAADADTAKRAAKK